MGSGERLISVSPEGHAWLVADNGAMSKLRIVDAFDLKQVLTQEIELADIIDLKAWSAQDGAALTKGGLWRIEGLSRIELAPPVGFNAGAQLCGDPSVNGSLLSDGKLFERRDDDQWWGWDSGASGKTAPSRLLSHQGECMGPDDHTWLASADGTLWKLTSTTVQRPVRFEKLGAAVVATRSKSEVILGVVDGNHLRVGPKGWQPWRFKSGAPRNLSSGAGALWMTSATRILRFDGETWNELQLDTALTKPPTGLIAHANGLWLSTDTHLCHLRSGPMLRVSGVRPYIRSKELDWSFGVKVNGTTEKPTASLNGKDLPLTLDAGSGTYRGKARLGEAGWHELNFKAGATTRMFPIKRLPEVERSWKTDIKPIYEEHCTGSDCHGGSVDKVPDLSQYDLWVSSAAQIKKRVVNAKNMPPASSRKSTWGGDDVQVIAQWLAGGMAP